MRKLLSVLLFCALATTLCGAAPGDEVAVVYNRRMPGSKDVAEHYALRRQVPAAQILGLELPTTEEISRAAFRDQLQMPLARWIKAQKLWQIGAVTIAATNGQPAQTVRRPVESKIRYLVLCYGVPLRITPDPSLVEEGSDQLRPEMRRNEAAVDNELAWLPHIENAIRLSGPLSNPCYTVTNAAALNPTNGVLMVARLDGPTPAIAQALVDKAMEAETNGLWGRAYFDIRSVSDPNYKLGDEWILAAAGIARLTGFETVIDTNATTFPVAFPMSQIALYAGWYDGDASGPFTRPTVEFMPGAIAYHLFSFSAATLRSTTQNWVGPFLAKGVTATMGCVWEPYLNGTPDIGVCFGRLLIFGFTFGEAAYACLPALSWQTTVVGDPLYRPAGTDPKTLHAELERRKSPLLDWSVLKWVNFQLVQKVPVAEMVAYLEGYDLTRKSAVLMEKLGDLYTAQGKPSTSVWAYEQALKLDPSPQQRVRLMLVLGEKLTALDRPAEASAVYEKLLEVCPDYPDKLAIRAKITSAPRQAGGPDATNHPPEVQWQSVPPPSGTPAPTRGTNAPN